MRRLIVEFNKDEETYENSRAQLKNVKTLEQLQILRQDQEELAIILRIEFEESVSNVEEYIKQLNNNVFEVKVLEKEKNGAFVIFVKARLAELGSRNPSTMNAENAFLVSRQISEGKVRVTFVGSAKQIRHDLEGVKKLGWHYRIVSLTDARFSVDSPLNALTEKQRKVLHTAYNMGYYSLPRRISSEQLAKKLKIHKTALVNHRRKAELRVLSKMFNEQIS